MAEEYICPMCHEPLHESKFTKNDKAPKYYCKRKCKSPKNPKFGVSEWDCEKADGDENPKNTTGTTGAAFKPSPAINNRSREASIEKQVCLKAAVEIVTAWLPGCKEVTPDIAANIVIDATEKMFDALFAAANGWVEGGKEKAK